MVKPSDGTATYLYCLVHHPRPPSVRGAPRGLPGTGGVRVLEAGDDFWLVTADAPLDRYGSAPIERGLRDLRWVSACAMSHEGVVEHFSRRATVIPMKLFTLFTRDERALAHVRRSRGRLRRLARRIGGRQEWGLRLTWADDAAQGARQVAGPARPVRSGTAFLLRKRRQREMVARFRQNALIAADRLYRRLARLADEARRHPLAEATGGVRIVLDAAFLVRISRAAAFRAAVKQLAPRLTSAGFQLTLSGPWPPYTFVAGTR
ncbi:MAG: GvpL/GvpF family gas vesicle protein [Candidatus Rokuibacteriota bacterium]